MLNFFPCFDSSIVINHHKLVYGIFIESNFNFKVTLKMKTRRASMRLFLKKKILACSNTNNDQIVVHTYSNPLLWRWIIKGDFVINFSFVTILQKVWTYRLESLLDFGGCLKKIDRIWCQHMLDSSLISWVMNKHLESFACIKNKTNLQPLCH